MRPFRAALLWASRNPWLAERVPRSSFARRAVRRFMPGENLQAAVTAAHRFAEDGRGSVFALLGENVADPAAADRVATHYIATLDRLSAEGLDSHISIKPTQLGLDIDDDLATRHVRRIADHAAMLGATVWVDMESSEYADRTLAMYSDVLARRRNVGICLQAYLRRTPGDMDALLEQTAAIRLVKGAYQEPPLIALTRRRDVDAAFLRLAVRLLRHSREHTDSPAPALATHDTRLLDQIVRTAETGGVRRDSWEVHMLYGIRDREQRRLAGEDHRVRVHISYGEAWYPWYVRRLAERPANVVFVVRSLAAG